MPIRSAAEPCARRLEQAPHDRSQSRTLIRKTSLSSDRSDSTAVKQCRHISITPACAGAPTHVGTTIPARRLAASRHDRDHARRCVSIATRVIQDAVTTNSRSDPTSSRCQISRRTRALRRASMRNCFLDGRTGESKLVEPIGIEPTTSCLQSTRSPN
jgi:hypothetical protein